MKAALGSVRFQLPALLVVVGAAVYTLSLFMALERATRTGLESREQAARTALNAHARVLATLRYRGDDEGVREVVSQLGAVSDVESAVYLDADDRIIVASRTDWRGTTLDSTLGAAATAAARRARADSHTWIEHTGDGFAVIAVPVRAGALNARGEVEREGLLVARLDFRQLISMLRRETVRFFAIMGVMTLLAVATVWVFLHLRVARPARRIRIAAGRLAAGERDVRTLLSGSDELAHAGLAFDDMARHLDEAETRVRRQQQLMDGLLRTLPVGVFVVDRATRTIVYVNQQVLEMSGYPVPVGMPISHLQGRREGSGGEEIPLQELPIERALAEGRPVRNDTLVYVQPDGTRVPVVTTAHPVKIGGGEEFDAVVAVVQDRRVLERAYADLRASEERFQSASFATGQAVYEWDLVGDVCRFSDSMRSVFGYRNDELDSNEKWNAITHPDDLPMVQRELESSRRERCPFECTYRIRHKDGRWRWVRDRGLMRFGASGQPTLMVGAVADVTDQRELEARLRQSQKMETVGTLAGGVAHDFNNQLTGVLGHLDLLAEDLERGDPRLEHVQTARHAAERCAELTRGLLAFSRMLHSESRAVDVVAVLEEVASLLRRVLPATIRLELTPEPGLPAVLADPTQLQQVVVNLCVNARDAMPDGGTLRLESRRAHVGEQHAKEPLARPGEYVCISVADEGVGIEPDVLPRIFEPFFTTKAIGEGTGLGLAMVYGIVSQHGGWVDVDSNPGRGSTFRVYVPADSSGQTATAPAGGERSGSVRYVPRAVLVVDDEAIIRTLARQLLERVGCRVIEAADGDAALRQVQQHPGEIDSVLLDLTMPGVPARDVVRELRRVAPRVRIVLTSGYAPEPDRPLDLAALPFLSKPWVPNRMLDLVCAPEDAVTN